MDHEIVCDCLFISTCETYADEMVTDARKASTGMGCTQTNDIHRRQHCKTFACRYLSMVMADMIGHRHPGDTHKGEA